MSRRRIPAQGKGRFVLYAKNLLSADPGGTIAGVIQIYGHLSIGRPK